MSIPSLLSELFMAGVNYEKEHPDASLEDIKTTLKNRLSLPYMHQHAQNIGLDLSKWVEPLPDKCPPKWQYRYSDLEMKTANMAFQEMLGLGMTEPDPSLLARSWLVDVDKQLGIPYFKNSDVVPTLNASKAQETHDQLKPGGRWCTNFGQPTIPVLNEPKAEKELSPEESNWGESVLNKVIGKTVTLEEAEALWSTNVETVKKDLRQAGMKNNFYSNAPTKYDWEACSKAWFLPYNYKDVKEMALYTQEEIKAGYEGLKSYPICYEYSPDYKFTIKHTHHITAGPLNTPTQAPTLNPCREMGKPGSSTTGGVLLTVTSVPGVTNAYLKPAENGYVHIHYHGTATVDVVSKAVENQISAGISLTITREPRVLTHAEKMGIKAPSVPVLNKAETLGTQIHKEIETQLSADWFNWNNPHVGDDRVDALTHAMRYMQKPINASHVGIVTQDQNQSEPFDPNKVKIVFGGQEIKGFTSGEFIKVERPSKESSVDPIKINVNIDQASLVPTGIPISPALPQWTCQSYDCPDLPPKESPTCPTCYTCGCKMDKL